METDWIRILSDWLQLALASATGAGLMIWGSVGGRIRALDRSVKDLESGMSTRLASGDQRLAVLESGASRQDPATCAGHMARLMALEQVVKAGPQHEDIARAHQRMDRLTETLSEIRGSLNVIRQQTENIGVYLMEHGPRAGESRP